MSKKQPPVCPYAVPYEDMKRERRGRKPSSPEAMRKQIDKALALMFAAGDFWTLETIRRLLACLVLLDDTALHRASLVMSLFEADAKQLKTIGCLINPYIHSRPKRKENC